MPADAPALWSIAVVALVALAAAVVTFFSGFGLGTILMPALAFFVPPEIAIGATALVHLANNIFKLGLVGRFADRRVLIRFGLGTVPFTFLGAWLLTSLAHGSPLATYHLGNHACQVTPLKLALATLILGFAVLELSPRFQKLELDSRWQPIGGALSGFFGGFSGHQGALRSAFLVRAGLSKEALVGTRVVLACVVDTIRLVVYGVGLPVAESHRLLDARTLWLVIPASVAALAGSLIGARTLRSVTMEDVRRTVGVMLVVVAVLLGTGVV